MASGASKRSPSFIETIKDHNRAEAILIGLYAFAKGIAG
jgi:hypothetical protein